MSGIEAASAAASAEPDRAAGAAETENRQPLDRARQPHPLDQQGVEARRGDPRGRDDDDGADFFDARLGAVEHPAGNDLKKVERAGDIGAVALGPGMRGVEPVERHGRIAPPDAAIGEDGQQPIEAG